MRQESLISLYILYKSYIYKDNFKVSKYPMVIALTSSVCTRQIIFKENQTSKKIVFYIAGGNYGSGFFFVPYNRKSYMFMFSSVA